MLAFKGIYPPRIKLVLDGKPYTTYWLDYEDKTSYYLDYLETNTTLENLGNDIVKRIWEFPVDSYGVDVIDAWENRNTNWI